MQLQNINVGTSPGAGNGDSLYDAFTKINANFANIESNVSGITNTVNSVAGRTGNIILSVSDIAGIYTAFASQGNITIANLGMKGYVDDQVTSLIIADGGLQSQIDSLVANAAVQAGLLADVADLAPLIANAATQAGQITSVSAAITTANLAMKGYVDSQAVTLNSTIHTANLAMKGYVDAVSAVWGANAGAQAGVLAVHTGNIANLKITATSHQNSIDILLSNAAVQSGVLASLTSNATSQQTQINSLITDLGSLTSTLTANAAVQAGVLSTLTANAAVQSGVLASLTANTAAQQNSIAILLSNAAVQSAAISDLASGNVAFAMDDFTHWTTNVHTISDAINQLAARIYSIENP